MAAEFHAVNYLQQDKQGKGFVSQKQNMTSADRWQVGLSSRSAILFGLGEV
jgi:hypothetical protein